MRRIVIGCCLLALVGCAQRAYVRLDPAAAQVGAVEQVFIGTMRDINPETGTFGNQRSEVESFARYDVSVPPDRKPGQIAFPSSSQKSDPERHFLITKAVHYPSTREFRSDLAGHVRALPRSERDAVIFVHGFNNTFADGLFRIAQLAHDIETPGLTMHYSWPSAANPLGYVADRDSSMFARDGLETLLRETAAAGVQRIIIVAHSMGAALTMETLRQMALSDDPVKNRIAGVILISPDIDVDLFRIQAQSFDQLPQPFVIFGSSRDTALSVSARITGQPERLGNLQDIARISDLQVTYLDTTEFNKGAGHFNVGDNPALLQIVGRVEDINTAFSGDQRGKVGLLPGVVLTVQNATQVIMAPVGAVANDLAQ